MSRRWLKKLLAGFGLALPLALLVSGPALADTDTPRSQTQGENCKACHAVFHESWEAGSHGQASVNAAFSEAWHARGGPKECMACHTTGYDPASKTWAEEGVACGACHDPAPDNHPSEPMPVSLSADACGHCHTEAYFAWQVSAHGLAEVDCANCHDPHATSLKVGSSSDLCAACHGTRAASFSHSVHYGEGLLCADCHLAPLSGEMAEGHARRDHTFAVDLNLCTQCHAYQLHGLANEPAEAQPTPDSLAATEAAQVSLEPDPVSPVFSVMLSGLLGMASGMILAPWLERWYRKIRSDEE